MRDHLQALMNLKELQVARYHGKNQEAVAEARTLASQLSLKERAYRRLRESVDADSAASKLKLSEIVGQDGVSSLQLRDDPALLLSIPFAFRREGYRSTVRGQIKQIVREVAAEEDWVMGERSTGTGRSEGDRNIEPVLRLYFQAYEAFWDDILSQVRVRRPNSVSDAQALASTLAQADSPLKRLLERIADETRLASGGPRESLAASVGSQAIASVKRRVSGELGSAVLNTLAGADLGRNVREMELGVEQHFEKVQRLARAGNSSQMDAGLAILKQVADDLSRIQAANSGLGAVELPPPSLLKARVDAQQFPPPLAEAILTLAEFGLSSAAGGVKRDIKAGVGGASALCARATRGKYPFSTASAEDIPIKDFVNVFKADGELDGFFKSKLEQQTDRSSAVWRPRTVGPGAPTIATLRQFQNADEIRKAFLGGGAAPSVEFDVAVGSSDTASVELDYYGEKRELKRGESVHLKWPATAQAQGVRISSGGRLIAQAAGPWGLFRLLDKSSQIRVSGGGDTVHVKFDGGNVVLEIHAESAVSNPFQLRALREFHCPSA